MKFMQTLKFKMPFVIISSVAIMLLVLMIVIISASAVFIEKTALRGFQETADGYRDLVSVWLNDQKDLTSVIAKESEFLDYFKNPNDLTFTIAKTELEELVQELGTYVSSLSLYDLNGNLLTDSSSGSTIQTNISDR